MKKLTPKALLLAALLLTPLAAICANVVSSDTELMALLDKEAVADTIYIKNGVYTQFNAVIARSGSAESPLVIMAETPGEVIFKEKILFKITGKHVVMNGFYFNAPAKKGTRQIIEITNDYNRITQCAFFGCDNRVAVSSVYQAKTDTMPQYTHIDHCYFADNMSWGLYLDLGKVTPRYDEKYAMYYRINNCYFSTPYKMGKNTGSSMRIGLGDHGTSGRCLLDNNLFERQNGEGELVENKSSENIYINNTFKNCEADMSFRQGHRTAFLHNHFIGTDKNSHSGALSMWMDGSIIAGNFFSFPYGSYIPYGNASMQPRNDRKPAAVVRFNCGYKDFVGKDGKLATHLTAQDNTFTNNLFYRCKDYLIDLTYIYRHLEWFGEGTAAPFNNKITNNDVVSGEFDNSDYLYARDYLQDAKNTNTIENTRIITAKSKKINEAAPKIEFETLSKMQSWLATLPGEGKDYDLNALANSKPATYKINKKRVVVELNKEPLSFEDVGPEWLTENPSTFAKEGYTPELIEHIKTTLGE